MLVPECVESFDIYLGDDISQLLGVELNGDPVDITSASEIEIDFPNDPAQNPPNPIFAATKTGGEISITDGPLGKLTLTLASAVTALLRPQQGFDVDIIVTIAGKETTYRIEAGANLKLRSPSSQNL